MKYLISYQTKQRTLRKVWNDEMTLPLDLPFRYFLEKTSSGVRLRSLTDFNAEYSKKDLLKGIKVKLDSNASSLQILAMPHDGTLVNGSLLTNNIDNSQITESFKKASMITMAAMALIIVISTIIPQKKEDEELVPEKFTKIIMQKQVQPVQKAASGPTNADNGGSKVKNDVVAKSATLQAFRSKAIQNSIKGLLKGGMTEFLKQSQNLAGSDATAMTKRAMSANATEGLASSNFTGMAQKGAVGVASIGGSGEGTGTAGYGKGERAGIAGQGKGYIGIEADGAQVDEGLTKEEVGRVIHAHISEIRYCHETAMLKIPNIEGKVQLAFVIGGNGSVKSVSVKESTLTDPWLEDCVIRRLNRWQFPKPRGGVDVSVAYPFIFKNL